MTCPRPTRVGSLARLLSPCPAQQGKPPNVLCTEPTFALFLTSKSFTYQVNSATRVPCSMSIAFFSWLSLAFHILDVPKASGWACRSLTPPSARAGGTGGRRKALTHSYLGPHWAKGQLCFPSRSCGSKIHYLLNPGRTSGIWVESQLEHFHPNLPGIGQAVKVNYWDQIGGGIV